MLYNITVPTGSRHYNLFVKTTKEHTLDELKQLLHNTDINEDMKDDIDFATKYCIERPEIESFLTKNGFKFIEIKESE